MVHFGAAKIAALYQATSDVIRSGGVEDDAASLSLARISSATPPDGNDFKAFLALYQTDRKHCLDHEDYMDNVRLTSELWDAASSCHDVGSFQPADLEVVKVVRGLAEHEDSAAPRVVHVKIVGMGVESRLRQQHYDAASQLNGYRRTVVLRPVRLDQANGETNGEVNGESGEPAPKIVVEPCMILLHGFDATGHGRGLERIKEAMEATEGSAELNFSLRAYELIDSEGFGGRSRTPERLRE
ncbi:hypothetical protein LTR85_004788 [Meristemomyces frigidus]|nr:hypothetical protein LTR85_004788 [Meristemomyces frigidus]